MLTRSGWPTGGARDWRCTGRRPAEWVGHDGNANGTSCYVRINPAGGWVVALTTNANTGAGLWRELQAELARAGVPINPPRIPTPRRAAGRASARLRRPVHQRRYPVHGEAGSDGAVYLSADGQKFVPSDLYEDLTFTFSAPDPTSLGQQYPPGDLCGIQPREEIYGIHVGGRLARRQLSGRLSA